MDVKKIGRIPDGGGWRAHGREMGSTCGRRSEPGSATTTSTPSSTTTAASPTPRSSPTRRAATCAAFLARAVDALRRPRHRPHRRGHDRQPLELHAAATTSPTILDARSASSTSSSSRTARGRTARSSGSTAPCRPSGPTGRSSPQRRTHRRPCTLARPLQHSTTPQRPRRPPPDQPPVTNLMAGYT